MEVQVLCSVSIQLFITCTYLSLHCSTNPVHADGWERGRVLADAQNFARDLMDTPSNLLTPTMFVDRVSERLGVVGQEATDPTTLRVVPR